MIDNGAAINIMPKATLRKLKQSTYTITSSSIIITSFVDERKKAEAVVTVRVTVGSRDILNTRKQVCVIFNASTVADAG